MGIRIKLNKYKMTVGHCNKQIRLKILCTSQKVQFLLMNVKEKLNSLKHGVRSQATHIKWQKSLCHLVHGISLYM